MDRFLAQAQHLRNKLTLWRFRNYYKVQDEAQKLEDAGIAKEVYDGAENISSRVKQVILPLWLIADESLRETLKELAKTFDSLLKTEDPDYLLELQAKEAVKEIIEDYGKADTDSSVNIRNMVNVLYEDPKGGEERHVSYYSMQLSLISRKVLKLRGANEIEITHSDVTSVSKSLKTVFETNLGFKVRLGKKRARVVIVPAQWCGEEKTPTGGLDDYV
jgi:hypothetical protein